MRNYFKPIPKRPTIKKMNKSIKTHFDPKVILVFVLVVLISGGIIAYDVKNKEVCTASDFVVGAGTFKVDELITFSDSSANAYQWRWDFGDGNISHRSKTIHQFKKPGDYLVTLKVNGYCAIEKVITIKPKVKVVDASKFSKFNIEAPEKIYEGDKITFEDKTKHATSWKWYFEGTEVVSATEKKPTYRYMSPGEKTIALVVNNNPAHVSFKNITVLPKKKEIITLRKKRIQNIINKPKKDVVVEHFQGGQIPDTLVVEPPPPPPAKVIPEMNESIFLGCLNGITKGQLDYAHFEKLFCAERLPTIILRDGSSVTLLDLFKDVAYKRKLKVKFMSISRNKDGCIDVLTVNYR